MDPEQGFTRLTPRLNCDITAITTNPSISQIRACWSFSIPVKTFARQNFPRVHADPINSNYAVLQLRRFIDSFFSLSPSTSNPIGSLPLSPQRKESSKHRSQPEALYGRAFFFFFFLFFLRPGSFRKRALTRWNRWRQSLRCISPGQFRYYEISAGIVYQAWLAARNDAAAIVRTGRKRRARNDEHRRRSRAHRGCINASPRSRHAILGYLGGGGERGQGEERLGAHLLRGSRVMLDSSLSGISKGGILVPRHDRISRQRWTIRLSLSVSAFPSLFFRSIKKKENTRCEVNWC